MTGPLRRSVHSTLCMLVLVASADLGRLYREKKRVTCDWTDVKPDLSDMNE